jgi:hypothetical protein
LFSEEGYPLNQRIAPASRSISGVAELEVVGLLQERIDRLIADFGFEHVKMAGEALVNRTTEPVVRFLLWLERAPEAQAAAGAKPSPMTGLMSDCWEQSGGMSATMKKAFVLVRRKRPCECKLASEV